MMSFGLSLIMRTSSRAFIACLWIWSIVAYSPWSAYWPIKYCLSASCVPPVRERKHIKCFIFIVLQTIYFTLCRTFSFIAFLFIESISRTNKYIVICPFQILVIRHPVGLNQVFLAPQLETIIPVYSKRPITYTLIQSHIEHNSILGEIG